MGRFAIGAELDKIAYERAVEAFSDGDPFTLVVTHDLGVSLRLMGHFRQALELDQRTYELKLRLLGADDRRSIITQARAGLGHRIGPRRPRPPCWPRPPRR
ncbi:tetratricopeptide repeat protein [Streptomyces avermitilis]|uniref:tetratricopeptide repeat protein n=1 Tax=Streptomyces avermitilis TaxID=33903 RepID=UPI0033BCA4E5